jgi:uridylate kinase
MKTKTVISLGGSLIVPARIDSVFLKRFRALIISYAKKRQFFIITGGGHTARHYRDGGAEAAALTTDDLHWLGIHATRLNAHLVRIIFGKHAHPDILQHTNKQMVVKHPVVLAGGGRPRATTDIEAVKIARRYGATEVLNLSDLDSLYDRDPKKYKNAKPIHAIDWKAFRKMFPTKVVPGFHGPFDPAAARLAQKLKLRVVLLNGRNLKNVKNYLDGKKFTGTVIEH